MHTLFKNKKTDNNKMIIITPYFYTLIISTDLNSHAITYNSPRLVMYLYKPNIPKQNV